MFGRLAQLFTRGKRGHNFIGFDKYRKRGAYHWQELHENADYRALIDTVARYVDADDAVLDVGCGDGAYLGVVAPKVREAWGVDADDVAVRLAKTQLREHGHDNCQVMHLRIDEAKAYFARTGQQFDVVWSADVIEHLPLPAELLELLVQTTKPAGVCMVGTPLFVSTELVSPYHVKEFARDEIRTLIEPYVHIVEELVFPHARKDGRTYEEGYYLAVGRPRSRP